MNKGWFGRALAFLRGSVRGQILTVLVGCLFVGSLLLALVYYFHTRRVALGQLRNSYSNLGATVSGLSAYNLQFNKSGLKDTVDQLVKADASLYWVEFADEKGAVVQAGGALKQAPYARPEGSPGSALWSRVDTPLGSGLLLRVPILVAEAASSGIGEIGFEAPQPTAGEHRVRRLGELRMVVGLESLGALRRGFIGFGALVVLLGTVAGTLLTLPVARFIVAPLEVLSADARRIAGGQLTGFREEIRRSDELGQLSATFREMGASLAGMVREARDGMRRVEEGASVQARQLALALEDAKAQESATREAGAEVKAIQGAVGEVSRLMEGLSELAEEVSSSVLQMAASIDQIAANTQGLNDAVGTVATTMTQNVAANREVDASTETLNRFVEDTSAAMTEMEGSIRQIEENAAKTRKATEAVASEAQAGAKAMEDSRSSVDQLRSSFASTTEVMKLLGRRSQEVGNILAVIDEVMEQTHLLALNAAIIAAQAGEHGKPFAVVAGEIKGLAEKTSVSTREISTIIDAVQRDVQQAVQAVEDQRAIVDETVAVAREGLGVFARIQEAVKPSLQMVQEIARATSEQSRGAAGIVRSTERLRDLAHQLRQATKEQTVGSEQVLEAVNRIRSLSQEVRRATSEQSAGSTLIRQAMDRLTSAVADVMAQNQVQSNAGRAVERAMGSLAEKSQAIARRVQESSDLAASLSQRAEALSRSMSRFRIEEG
ncbi:MAG: methyl-accepting chemotaxis protein [Acidobacteriota bacterium]